MGIPQISSAKFPPKVHIQSGLAAARPAAGATVVGCIYQATDTNVLSICLQAGSLAPAWYTLSKGADARMTIAQLSFGVSPGASTSVDSCAFYTNLTGAPVTIKRVVYIASTLLSKHAANYIEFSLNSYAGTTGGVIDLGVATLSTVSPGGVDLMAHVATPLTLSGTASKLVLANGTTLGLTVTANGTAALPTGTLLVMA